MNYVPKYGEIKISHLRLIMINLSMFFLFFPRPKARVWAIRSGPRSFQLKIQENFLRAVTQKILHSRQIGILHFLCVASRVQDVSEICIAETVDRPAAGAVMCCWRMSASADSKKEFNTCWLFHAWQMHIAHRRSSPFTYIFSYILR